jgi:hypothetical protein
MPLASLTSANTLQSWRLRVNDVITGKVDQANPNTSGLFAHTGRMTISTNLTVTGNTSLGAASLTNRITRNTSAGINSPSSRFALATTNQADFHIASSINGASTTNTQQYGMTFSPAGGSTQAGVVFSENGGDGTALGIFLTNSYAAGPQLRASIDPTGNFTAVGNVTAYSDEKLKTDITTIENALALVEQMRGVRYNRIEDGKAGVGVIAQEMQQVLPEVILEGDNLSVAYGNLVGVLIEAVKELSARVKELEAK